MYVTARQGSFYALTYEWLARHAFPPGPIVLTESRMAALPGRGRIGAYEFAHAFKVSCIERLRAARLGVYAVYGNTRVDIDAALDSGVPPSQVFTVGPAAGARGTRVVRNWTAHVRELWEGSEALPQAAPAIPYADLSF